MTNTKAAAQIDLEQLAAKTYAAVFSDACDRAGRRSQTMAPGIDAHTGPARTLVGWARVARYEPVEEPPVPHYAAEIAFLDSLHAGDVVLATAGGTPAALWGELFSSAAMAARCQGAVIDGLMRDRERVEVLGFSVHARGTRPTDSLGRVSLVDTDGPVEIGGVSVFNGDLVVADVDGIVIVPNELAREVTAYALDKAATERKGLALLSSGALLVEVWERFGVL